MSLHNVSAKTGVGFHRTFQIDFIPRLKLSKAGTLFRLTKNIGGKTRRIAPGDGQARAIDGHRFTRHKRLHPWIERELNHKPASAADSLDRSDFLYKTSKHFVLSIREIA
jgi:hypothetical protein